MGAESRGGRLCGDWGSSGPARRLRGSPARPCAGVTEESRRAGGRGSVSRRLAQPGTGTDGRSALVKLCAPGAEGKLTTKFRGSVWKMPALRVLQCLSCWMSSDEEKSTMNWEQDKGSQWESQLKSHLFEKHVEAKSKALHLPW